MEIKGNVFKIMPEITGQSQKGIWQKQEFIIETKENYPKKICFSVWGDKTDIVKTLKNGETITVSFNPESREYNDRWYTDLRAWKIQKENRKVPVSEPASNDDFNGTVENFNENIDDMPF